MPWLHEFLKFVSRSNRRPRATLGIRVLATVLSAVLVFGSLAPGIAFAGEADSEQEGAAPPGALPGLEGGPELEPGGEESVLEELPGSLPSGGEGEEEAPLETEPAQEPEPPPPPASAPPAATEAAPPAEPPPGPEYGPSYEAAAAPSSEPVEGDTLVAPPSSPPSVPPVEKAGGAAQLAAEAPAPAPPAEEAPAPEAPPPASVPKQSGEVPGGLSGRAIHTVRSGECLWSIAAALLPAGADNAEIAAEVQRLWKLNAGRIGTGDPSLIYAGTELRLR
ncbi:MAG TPA: LysM domain-containing protein [Solirubrobacterales bacterium]|nr:LysM domain-containing protein [Solirubrobacterales bacterium]